MELKKLGRYDIGGIIGRGGFAVVYRARDPLLGREVAIKVVARDFAQDPDFRARFQSELKKVAWLEHPAIVPIYDFGEENSTFYIVMAFMPGYSLTFRLQKGRIDLAEVPGIAQRIGQALTAAHARGILHRNLGSSNILFDASGRAYVSDFGVAWLAQTRTAQTGMAVIGTPGFMSPEQAVGNAADARSDIYSFGVVLFQLLTGRLPFEADTPVALLVKHVSETPPRLADIRPDLPSACQAVIDRALAKRPADRYQSAQELADALEAALRSPRQAPVMTESRPSPTVGTAYADFDLVISRYEQDVYRARLVSSPAGEATLDFKLPFDLAHIQTALAQAVKQLQDPPAARSLQDIGSQLFEALFHAEIGTFYRLSTALSDREDRGGLRLRLCFDGVPEIAALPWECLYDPALKRFIALSARTPLVRYLSVPRPMLPLAVQPPLQVLVVAASPPELPAFDAKREINVIRQALDPLIQRGLAAVSIAEQATLRRLNSAMRRQPVHILHFIGHTVWNEQAAGALAFEDEQGATDLVSVDRFARLAADATSLRLIFLNVSEDRRESDTLSLNHMAATLIQQGLPAVITLQAPIIDRSAIVLAQVFYEALVDGYPVEQALAEARKELFAIGSGGEWMSPALHMSVSDGRLFDLVTAETVQESQSSQIASDVDRALSVRRANEQVTTLIGRLATCTTPAAIAASPQYFDWLPQSLIPALDTDIVEILPGLLAVAKDISATRDADLYSRRLGLHQGLDNLSTLRERMNALGDRAKRWERVLDAWQEVLVRELDRLQQAQSEQRVANLYVAGNPLQLTQKGLFKGRRDLRDAIVSALLERTRPTLVLQGPRRMGKTSFLLQLPALLPGKTIPVFVDLQKGSSTASDSAFLYETARALVRAAERYRVNLALPERAKLSESPFEVFDTWLDQSVMPDLKDFNVLLTFDEFEKVGEALNVRRLSNQVLDELRHTIQHRTQFALLFAGVQTLDEMGPEWSSYFINVRVLTMGYLSAADAEELIRHPDPAAPFGLQYADRAVKRILADTLGQPYLIQLVGSSIVEIANTRQTQQADVDLVDAGETLAMERGEPYFRNVWDEMAGPIGQPLLRQIAEAGTLPLSPAEPDARQALERMRRQRVIAKTKVRRLFSTVEAYSVEVPLVRRWIVERAPA